MKVKCKFLCNSVTDYGYQSRVEMTAIIGDSGEDKEFYTATPNGSVTFNTVNKTAAKEFVPGMKYYLYIEKADQ